MSTELEHIKRIVAVEVTPILILIPRISPMPEPMLVQVPISPTTQIPVPVFLALSLTLILSLIQT